jgi:hypothetical protein
MFRKPQGLKFKMMIKENGEKRSFSERERKKNNRHCALIYLMRLFCSSGGVLQPNT